jgi:hypothetical protein
LEERDFYNEDLKCGNIIREEATGDIYFIDFSRCCTEGFYRKERGVNGVYNLPEAIDYIFTLGKSSGLPTTPIEAFRWIELATKQPVQ